MRIGHEELIALLNFCTNRCDIQTVKRLCPLLWNEISFSGRLLSTIGLSRTNWWKERYLFPFVIRAVIPFLSRVSTRSFLFSEEGQLERIWQVVFSSCSENARFSEQLRDAYSLLEELLHAPFPKFTFVQRAYQDSGKRRGFQEPSWLGYETLSEYETRLSKTSEKTEGGYLKVSKESPQQLFVNHSLVKQFRSLQAKVVHLENDIARERSLVRKMNVDSVILRFEDQKLSTLVKKASEGYERLVVEVGTLNLDVQEWEICGHLKDEEGTRGQLMFWDKQLSACIELFESWSEESRRLTIVLQEIFEKTRTAIKGLRFEIDTLSQRLNSHPHKQLAAHQLKQSNDLLRDYEKSFLSPPGPLCTWGEVNKIVRENLNFFETLAQNPVIK